ncbi:J domain-containing protein [Actinomadura roseirufa]|uniref:J domain-containing protein n=1 Tax=Actinomadura roseirufa TaxID=2094049 RepID=UPI001041978A|nr:J domain-containing protein [Actinomadura roseirufa]
MLPGVGGAQNRPLTVPEAFGELAGKEAYALLGLSPDATAGDVQSAWRSLARTHHPDHVTDPGAKAEAEETLRLINIARDVLLHRRAAYDAFLNGPDEEPEEIIDDPWDAADAGSPAGDPQPPGEPSDPWETAPRGRAVPHAVPPPRRPPPPHMPPPHVPPPWAHRRRSRLSRRTRLAIACGIPLGLLCLVFLGTAAILAVEDRTSVPDPEAPVPPGFAGTWQGTVRDVETNQPSWDVKLSLRTGWHIGEVSYMDGRCKGKAVPTVLDTEKNLTVRTVFSNDRDTCNVGDLHLTHRRDGRLDLVYYMPGQQDKSARGTLDHK